MILLVLFNGVISNFRRFFPFVEKLRIISLAVFLKQAIPLVNGLVNKLWPDGIIRTNFDFAQTVKITRQ